MIGEVPRPINLEAEAGTIMVFDGRVIHGTGVNRTNQKRFVATSEQRQTMDANSGELEFVGSTGRLRGSE